MEHELTVDQAREIAALRQRHAPAELVVHLESWGLIVEARRGGHTLEVTGLDWTGAVRRDRRVIPRRTA